jgi:hypothetical protein
MATDEEKLQALLPHWMEHNDEHAAEFRTWAGRARAAGQEEAAHEIETASQALDAVNASLRAALEALGNPA